MAIQFILVLNRQGKTRVGKWYTPLNHTQQSSTINQVHRLISSRDHKSQSNFVEFQQNKLVYRRYAGLFFIACIELADNELAYLEHIHLFVEVLDDFFNNVCELDLVFNFYKVYSILDEIYLAGEFNEISKSRILDRLQYLDKLE